MIDFSLVFVAGLLGSTHCVGMCGGFILTISVPHRRSVSLVRQVSYLAGKTLTYTAMGAAVGLFGATLGATFAGVQDAISVVAGVVMLVIGLGLLGVLKRFKGMGTLMNWPPFRKAARYVVQKRTATGAFGLGLLNGLLPCGLVYGMLVMAAATGTMLGGALTLFVFGVATVPALFVLGWVGHLLRSAWRHRLHMASGVVVVLLGLVTVLRGTPLLRLLLS